VSRLVGVVPVSAFVTLSGARAWTLGGAAGCNVYVSTDVTLCTASILILFAISRSRQLPNPRPKHAPPFSNRLRHLDIPIFRSRARSADFYGPPSSDRVVGATSEPAYLVLSVQRLL